MEPVGFRENPDISLPREEKNRIESKPAELAKKHLPKEGAKEAPKVVQRKAKKVTQDDSGIEFTSGHLSPKLKPQQTKRRSSMHEIGRAGLMPRWKDVIKTVTPTKNLFEAVEERHLGRKSSPIFDCIRREADKSGGYLYTFTPKPGYDDLTPASKEEREKNRAAAAKSNEKMYPAINSLASSLEGYDSEYLKKPSNRKALEDQFRLMFPAYLPDLMLAAAIKKGVDFHIEMRKFLGKLGYKFKVYNTGEKQGFYVTFPDLKVLKSRWKELQEKMPGLADLDIVSSTGTAKPLDFVMKNIQHEGILSSNKEFIHDHTAHIMALIEKKFESYVANRELSKMQVSLENQGMNMYEKARAKLLKYLLKGYQLYSMGKNHLEFKEKEFELKRKEAKKLLKDENLSSEQAQEIKKSLGETKKSLDETKGRLDKIEMSLSATVDRITNIQSLLQYNQVFAADYKNTEAAKFLEDFFLVILSTPEWMEFFVRHFDEGKIKEGIGPRNSFLVKAGGDLIEDVLRMWKEIKEIEKDINASHKKWQRGYK